MSYNFILKLLCASFAANIFMLLSVFAMRDMRIVNPEGARRFENSMVFATVAIIVWTIVKEVYRGGP